MSNEITTHAETVPAWMQPQNIEQAMALAENISKSGLMPDHLRGQPGNILLILDQAQRWNMSPVAVAQCTSVVHGKLMYEGKLVHAALISMGAIRGPLRFEFSGNKGTDKRQVTVSGTLPDGRVESVEGTVADWKTSGNGSPWKPGAYDKMLSYRGAREWARMYAPAAMLGVYTPDEFDDAPVIDAEVIPPAEPAKAKGGGKKKAAKKKGPEPAQDTEPTEQPAEDTPPEQEDEPSARERMVQAGSALMSVANQADPGTGKELICAILAPYGAKSGKEVKDDDCVEVHTDIETARSMLDSGVKVADVMAAFAATEGGAE